MRCDAMKSTRHKRSGPNGTTLHSFRVCRSRHSWRLTARVFRTATPSTTTTTTAATTAIAPGSFLFFFFTVPLGSDLVVSDGGTHPVGLEGPRGRSTALVEGRQKGARVFGPPAEDRPVHLPKQQRQTRLGLVVDVTAAAGTLDSGGGSRRPCRRGGNSNSPALSRPPRRATAADR